MNNGPNELKALVEKAEAIDRKIAEKLEDLTLEDVAEQQRATYELLVYLNEDYHAAN